MSSPALIVTILYPAKEDGKFDQEYYLATHIPMAKKTWSGLGMTSCTVCSLDKSSGYIIKTVTTWESEEAFNAAIAAEGTKAVMGDVPNFTNLQPAMLVGKSL